MNSSNNTEKGYGNLIFRVTTARGAIPIKGARVHIFSYYLAKTPSRGDIVYSVITGPDGKTPTMRLETYPKANSLSPGSFSPYAIYNAEVVLAGYYTQYYATLQIFDGVTSIQSADMIPLPENGLPNYTSPDGEQFFDSPRNDL